jgi:hypothetical protein
MLGSGVPEYSRRSKRSPKAADERNPRLPRGARPTPAAISVARPQEEADDEEPADDATVRCYVVMNILVPVPNIILDLVFCLEFSSNRRCWEAVLPEGTYPHLYGLAIFATIIGWLAYFCCNYSATMGAVGGGELDKHVAKERALARDKSRQLECSPRCFRGGMMALAGDPIQLGIVLYIVRATSQYPAFFLARYVVSCVTIILPGSTALVVLARTWRNAIEPEGLPGADPDERCFGIRSDAQEEARLRQSGVTDEVKLAAAIEARWLRARLWLRLALLTFVLLIYFLLFKDGPPPDPRAGLVFRNGTWVLPYGQEKCSL